ncbi:MAG: nucleotidyl transferase AbiEii/AbiGii toxin family protein [Thermoplasmata archaeon]
MLAQHLGVKDQELLEKDVRLHALLARLVRDPTFGPHLAFKGGTCLIKCYLDYPRFSTDLDFTWIAEPGLRSSPGGTKAFRRGIRPTQRTLETWIAGKLPPTSGGLSSALLGTVPRSRSS